MPADAKDKADAHDQLLQRLAQEARVGGLIVRCESYGVFAAMHPRHARPEDIQPGLSLTTEPPTTAGD